MIEDALDHLVDGPRTSPALVRRLLIRACGDASPDLVTQGAIERFEEAYERASAALPDAAGPSGQLDGGTRGALLRHEASLRVLWRPVREGIVLSRTVADGHGGSPGTADDGRPEGAKSAAPFPDDWDDGMGWCPDGEFLMLEPPELIARRERRRAKLRAIGAHAARVVLAAAAVGVVVSAFALLFAS